MIEWILALFLLLAGTPTDGKASVFGGVTDKHRGKKTYCYSPARKVTATDWGVATRYAPDGSRGKCGEPILIINPRTGLWTIAPRIGAGPYGAIVDKLPDWYKGPARQHKDGRWWYVKKYRRWPGRWIGVADLTRPVAKAIGHRGGKERVILYRLPDWGKR